MSERSNLVYDASQPDAVDAHRERLELVLEGTRLGMWDWNPQTNEVVFDERWAEMLGYKLEEIEFTLESWQSRVHPDDLQACHDDIAAHLEGRVPFYENVHRMRHKDGRWVHILDRGRVMARDAEGRPVRFTGTHTDITVQREAELRAKDLARARTQFLAMMSHEIRTPLHGMLGIVEILQATELSPEQRQFVRILENSGDSLLVLINDILDFAHADDGRLSIIDEPFDIHEVLNGVVALFTQQASQKGLSFTCERDSTLGSYVQGDGHRLRQILVNLVGNAIKFTDTGHVTLRAQRTGDELLFTVTDTGRGINDTERIFYAYEREDQSNARRHEGVGLGLSIVRLLIARMGGQVGVESQLGEGSRFWVCLPMPVTHPSSDARHPTVVGDLPPMRVLVADDNLVNQIVIRSMLQSDGHHCEVVDSGSKAISAALADEWDCIFLDLHMPELTGEEAAREIRAAGVTTRIVAASADVMPETRARCIEGGIQGFLPKPFKRNDLLKELSKSVAGGQAR